MPEVISPLLLGVPLGIALLLLWRWFGFEKNTLESYFAANRAIGTLVGAVSIASCWTWVFALVVGPQRAYQGGAAALAWFVIPNTLAIALFACLSTRMHELIGGRAYTLTEFIRERYDGQVASVYAFAILVVQGGYAVVAQLIGAYLLINYATGADRVSLVIAVAVMMVALAVLRGVQSSLSGDAVKAGSIVLITAMLAYLMFFREGVAGMLLAGSAGSNPAAPRLFDWPLMGNIGIPTAISLLSAVAIDQQLWQRAFSLSTRVVRRASWLAVPIFFAIVSAIGSLGFIAAQVNRGPLPNPQVAGFVSIRALLPFVGAELFIVAIGAALVATGASALNAASSIWAADLFRAWRPRAKDSTAIVVSRLAMVLIVLTGTVLALRGTTLDSMLLFVGTFRGALLFPTVLALYSPRRRAPSRFFTGGILAGMVGGVLVALTVSVLAGGLMALAVTAIVCAVEWLRSCAATKS